MSNAINAVQENQMGWLKTKFFNVPQVYSEAQSNLIKINMQLVAIK
jgi:hypothetical protein